VSERDIEVVRALPLVPEIVDTYTDEEIWERAFQAWAWECNRNSERVTQQLAREWDGTGNIPPKPGTIRQRVRRENWHQRALVEAGQGKERRVKRSQEAFFELYERSLDFQFELFANGMNMDPAYRRDMIVATQGIIKGSGIGAYGAHSGGLMDPAIDDIHAVDANRPLSITERQNRLMRKREEENR
jgi:hypothetical protein